MRPRGMMAEALASAAAQAPGTVREISCRTGVPYDVARYTASRLLARGELALLGAGRPAVIGSPAEQHCGAAALGALLRSPHWRRAA